VVVIVMVTVVVEVRGEISGHERGLVVVVVLVDDDGRAICEHHPPAESLGEQIGHEDVLGTTVSEHTASHEQDPIRARGLAEVVGRKNDRAAAASVFVDHLEDSGLTREVEASDGFVEEQYLGSGGDRLGHQHPLPLASRERAEGSAAKMRNFEAFRRAIDRLAIGPLEAVDEAPVATHPKYLVDRQRHPGVMGLMLRDEGDPPEDIDGTGGWLEQPGDQVEQRRLATAVRANEGERASRTDGEVGRSQGDHIAMVDAHPRRYDDRNLNTLFPRRRDRRLGLGSARFWGCDRHRDSVS
jgi:hypothetical protein